MRPDKESSARRRAANRRNARASTGPRTSAGKARAAQNARRHGLSARHDPSRAQEVAALASAIADAGRGALASAIAAAQIDLVRARRVRADLIAAVLAGSATIARLAALERYERRAWSRRKRAIRGLDHAS
jgi:hypothetical protein